MLGLGVTAQAHNGAGVPSAQTQALYSGPYFLSIF